MNARLSNSHLLNEFCVIETGSARWLIRFCDIRSDGSVPKAQLSCGIKRRASKMTNEKRRYQQHLTQPQPHLPIPYEPCLYLFI